MAKLVPSSYQPATSGDDAAVDLGLGDDDQAIGPNKEYAEWDLALSFPVSPHGIRGGKGRQYGVEQFVTVMTGLYTVEDDTSATASRVMLNKNKCVFKTDSCFWQSSKFRRYMNSELCHDDARHHWQMAKIGFVYLMKAARELPRPAIRKERQSSGTGTSTTSSTRRHSFGLLSSLSSRQASSSSTSSSTVVGTAGNKHVSRMSRCRRRALLVITGLPCSTIVMVIVITSVVLTIIDLTLPAARSSSAIATSSIADADRSNTTAINNTFPVDAAASSSASSSIAELAVTAVTGLQMLLSFLLALEVAIHMWARGFCAFMHIPLCVVDLLVTLLDIISLGIEFSGLEVGKIIGVLGALRATRFVRILRLLRVAKKIKQVQLLASGKELVSQDFLRISVLRDEYVTFCGHDQPVDHAVFLELCWRTIVERLSSSCACGLDVKLILSNDHHEILCLLKASADLLEREAARIGYELQTTLHPHVLSAQMLESDHLRRRAASHGTRASAVRQRGGISQRFRGAKAALEGGSAMQETAFEASHGGLTEDEEETRNACRALLEKQMASGWEMGYVPCLRASCWLLVAQQGGAPAGIVARTVVRVRYAARCLLLAPTCVLTCSSTCLLACLLVSSLASPLPASSCFL